MSADRASIEAAGRIFDHTVLVGLTPAAVTALLGPPDERTGTSEPRWSYIRHSGVGGVIRVLRIVDNRVVAVEIQRTQ